MNVVMILVLMTAFFAYQRSMDQKVRRLQQRAGAAILKIGCPVSRSMRFWCAFPTSLGLITSSVLKLSSRTGWDVIPGLLGLGGALMVVVSTVLRLRRDDLEISAILTQRGIMIGDGEEAEGDFVPWDSITRWTWSHMPDLQLNLYDGRQVRSIRVAESMKSEIDAMVEREVASARERVPS